MLALVAIAGITCAIVLAALLHGWQRDWLRGQVEMQISNALAMPVSIEAIDGRLYREVEVHDVRLGATSEHFARLDRLYAKIDILALFTTSTFALYDVRVEGLDLRPARAPAMPETGETKDDPTAEGGGAWPLTVRVESLTLEDGVVEQIDRDTGRLRVEWSGAFDVLELPGPAALRGLRLRFALTRPDVSPAAALRGTLKGQYAHGRWQAEHLRVEGAGVRADASGRGEDETLEAVDLQLEVASLEALGHLLTGRPFGVSGTFGLSMDLHGPLTWPRGEIHLEAHDLRRDDLHFGDLSLDAVSRDAAASDGIGTLRIEALELRNGLLEATSAPGALVIVRKQEAELRDLQLRAAGGAGSLGLEAQASLEPLLEGEDGASRLGPSLLDDDETRLAIDIKAWPLETFEAVWRLVGFETSGTLDAGLEVRGAPGGPILDGSVSIAAGTFRQPPLDADQRNESDPNRADRTAADLAIEGVDLAAEITGPWNRPEIALQTSASALAWRGRDLGSPEVSLRSPEGRSIEFAKGVLRDGVLPIRLDPGSRIAARGVGVAFSDFRFEIAGQAIEVAGELDANTARDLRIAFDSLDVAQLSTLAESLAGRDAEFDLDGELTGRFTYDGPFDSPRIEGNLRWSTARLGEFEFDRIALSATTRDDALRLTSRWTRGATTPFEFEAAVPLDRVAVEPAGLLADTRTWLQLDAHAFDLAALEPFLPPSVSQLAGTLNADLRLAGGAGWGRATGHVSIDDASTTLPALGGQMLAPIRVRLSIEPRALVDESADHSGNRLVVDVLRIGDEASGLIADGSLDLAQGAVRQVDARMEFQEFPIDAPGLVEGTLDGPLELIGSPTNLDLHGRLELADLRIRIPEPDDEQLKEVRVLSTGGDDPGLELREDESARSWLDPLQMDVEVVIARNSWARGRGAEVELEGELAAKKERGAPLSLRGTVETVRGVYELYGRRFRIERGEATLDGGVDVDPLLDVRAAHRVREVRIIAVLGGRLSEPVLRFESQPELTETDIASYLLLGRPAAEAGDGQQTALDAAAAEIAAGVALRQFERMYGGALPVDLLELRLEGEGDDSEVRAGVGKYVGDRLFLYYERGFGDEGGDELKAEFELTPRWSVESNVSSDGETGGDLVFEIEY